MLQQKRLLITELPILLFIQAAFTFALTGWEGSASDACLWANAHWLHIPDECFLLADAGFPHCKELLVPYQGVYYHLAEHR
jgi:hypothetical protein